MKPRPMVSVMQLLLFISFDIIVYLIFNFLLQTVTKVEGVVGEKRKSIAEVEVSLSPKKARIEGTEEVTAAAINSNSVEAVVV